MRGYSVLLDGGFLKRKLGSARRHATAADVVAFVERLRAMPTLKGQRLHRVYFYDAAPSTEVVKAPFGGKSVDLRQSPTLADSTMLHAQLARQDFFALRLGELAVRGWKPKRNLQHVRQPSIELTADDVRLDIHFRNVA